MKKIKVSSTYENLKQFLESLPEIFEDNGETLKDDRNKIKVIEHNGLKLCIKSFNKVTTFNKYMYSWFRSSKAKRSFEIAQRLEKEGIDTPQPVAYVEVYSDWHILQKALYVSLYEEHEFEMTDVLKKNIYCQEKILNCFARYMATVVHPAGAWHNDLSPGNVLINSVGVDKWKYSFIDLNRLTFRRRISPHKGLVNLKKLSSDPVALAIMAEQYAIDADRNPRYYSLLLLRGNFYFLVRRFFSKKILGIFKSRRKRDS